MTKVTILPPAPPPRYRSVMLNHWAASMALSLLLSIFLTGCTPRGSSPYDLLQEAEALVRQGKSDQAIQRYHDHIAWRLSVKDRPEWENPYFYLLLIGDLHAEIGNMTEALSSYQDAHRLGIETALVSDRYRFLAHKMELQGDLKGALEILRAHRELDPLLFDAMLDRVSRALTLQEQLDDSKETDANAPR
ncbi:MAG: hypothetical protein QY326_09550 [Bdellovibrionota bacterium]|nr:MAG: hypothetical protein QY326_09550 [Bdellovibrionota bacterium]